MLHVRPAEPYDAPDIAAILEDVGVLQVAAEPEALTRRRLRGMIERAAGPAHDVFVAERGEAGVIGFASVSWTLNFRHGVDGLVSDLFVRGDARGAGAGTALLERIEREGCARGCVRLVLYSGRGGDAYARGFYPKRGFREHDELATFTRPLPPEGA